MSTAAARRGRRSFICGPPDSACWLYGTRIADDHHWEQDDADGPWRHGEGPLCVVCGLPRGTYEGERAGDAHRAELGHGLGTGACDDVCGVGFDPFAASRP